MIQMSEYMTGLERACRENDFIDRRLYDEYDINQGLRDEKGNGVLTGLTNISLIKSYAVKNGAKEPCDGELWYRGYRVEDLIGSLGQDEMGYEKIAYLLLVGELPDKKQYAEFRSAIGTLMALPTNFTRDVIMKAPTDDIMNTMTRSILTLASYDWDLKKTSLENNIRQCLQLISQFPTLAVYAYNAYNHYQNLESMFIHYPDPELSPAENILTMLRPDKKYTKTEAKVLDTALILHMEHGGANIKVMDMMADISENVSDADDDEELSAYLEKILDKQTFDRKGLIYGMGHAVYTLSDPREKVLKSYVKKLAAEKDRTDEFHLYEQVERIAPQLIMSRKHNRGVCPNVDFYSGFVYDMLGIPKELYTAIFAVARIVGWSAHRIEEIVCTDKIIRPAYMSVMKKKEG